MEQEEKRIKMISEIYSSEILSIVLDLISGALITILILPFKSFPVLILIVPGLLSVRGNVGGSFTARNSNNLIIGNFNKNTLLENISAAFILGFIAGFLLGLCAVLFNIFIIKFHHICNISLFFLPILTILFDQMSSLSISTLFSSSVFKLGHNPHNIVNPIMTGIEDITIVLFFYLSIILLGVP
ncbi:MAG: magnesium transporter [Promethearchaeia archaeon]